MSQVYDVPRYKDQVLNKVRFFLGMVGHDISGFKINGNDFVQCATTKDNFIMGYCDVLEDVGLVGDEELTEDDLYNRFATSHILMNPTSENMVFSTAVGAVIEKILNLHGSSGVWADSHASLRIVHGYLSRKYVAKDSSKYWASKDAAEIATTDIITAGLVACRHGAKVRERAVRTVKHVGRGSLNWREMHNWYVGMSYLRTSSVTPANREAHEALRSGCGWCNLEEFSFKDTRCGKVLGIEEGFRVVNLFFLVYSDALYIMDHSMLDQLHLIAKRWEGNYGYAENYRACGQFTDDSGPFTAALNTCRAWICSALEETNFSDALPRVMKQSLALAQNKLHTSAETLDVGHEEKTKKLDADIKEILDLKVQWHDLFESLEIPDRQKMDLMTLYYAFPSPDCDLRLLFKKASEVMQSPNKADPEFFEGFLDYCKAYDLCKLISKARAIVSHETVEGYTIEEKPWVKKCLKGQLTLPPDDEMGKAWASGVFPFINTVVTWYWEASDVTRVVPDIEVYRNTRGAREVPRNEHNELLYALEHAPDIVPGLDPAEAFTRVIEGRNEHSCIAGMAAKNENTKPGKKARETWSADAITREVTTAYDRTALPLAAAYEGASIRKADYAVQRGFDKVCSMTDPDSAKKVIIISNDVSGWSPSGDREAWGKHHDYVSSISRKPSGLTMSAIWKGIRASLNKRGYINEAELEGGLFQGWTGTIDTLLNLHLSLYSVRVAKRRGILKGEEGAITASLIDDAVQAIELVGTLAEQQAAASGHFKTTLEVWEKCAAVIDPVKTLYSSVKFIFLNRLFCEGSEVLYPMKVFARADKEWNTRFASIHTQFDTVFGSFRSTVLKGGDPIVCYAFAVQRCVHLAMQTNRLVRFSDAVRLVNAFFAPRSLGGWGLPHLHAWLTQECKDRLSMYTFTMCSLSDAANDPSVKESIRRVVGGTLLQKPKNASLGDVVGGSTAARAAGVVDPTAAILSTIKRGMKEKCKSRVFRCMLGCGETEETRDIALQILKSCTWDASVLDLVGQCLPSAHASALVDRAYRNELVVQLFPFSVRSRLITRLKNSNAESLMHTFRLPFMDHFIDVTRQCAFDLADVTREIYYDANNLHVVNHTLPDYPSSLAARPVGTPGSISTTCVPLKTGCPSEQANYRNLYDGRVPGDKLSPGKSKGVYTFTGERLAGMSALRRSLNKAAVVATYVSAKGGAGNLIWDLILILWGCKGVAPIPRVHFRIDPSSSTKRLSPSLSHVTHEIASFRNTQGVLKVDASRIGRHMGSRSLHVDYMSFVTALRSVALIEASCMASADDVEKMSLNYAILSGCLPQSSKVLCSPHEDLDIGPAMARLRDSVGEGMWQEVLAELKNAEFAVDEEDDVAGVDYSANDQSQSEPVLKTAHGYIATLILSSVPVPAAASRATVVQEVHGDERSLGRITRADRLLKGYASRVGTTQAILCTLLELTLRLFPSKLNFKVLKAQTARCTDTMEAEFPNWVTHYIPMVHWARSRCNGLDRSIVTTMFPQGVRWEGGIASLSSLSTREDKGSLQAATMLYRTANGRPMSTSSYPATSALGLKHIAKCWNVAHIVRKGERTRRGVFVQSEVYQSLAIHAKADASRAVLCEAVVQGIVNAAVSLSKGIREMKPLPGLREEVALDRFLEWISSVELPSDEAARGIVDGVNTRYFKDALREAFQTLDPEGIKKQNSIFIDNIITDIYFSNETTALLDSVEPVIVGGEDKELLPVNVEEEGEVVVEDIADDAEEGEGSQSLVKATTAFNDGVHMLECIEILGGQKDYATDDTISREEMEYFMDCKRAFEAGGASGADEAL